MTDVPAQGTLAQFCVDTAAPIDTSSVGMEILSSTLRAIDNHVHSPGLRGTRSRLSARVRNTTTTVNGTIPWPNPCPDIRRNGTWVP